MLAYGLPADAIEEYVKTGESTTIESMKRFYRAMIEIFSKRYLRATIANNVARLLHIWSATWISKNAREFRLYALEVKKLSNSMSWTIYKT